MALPLSDDQIALLQYLGRTPRQNRWHSFVELDLIAGSFRDDAGLTDLGLTEIVGRRIRITEAGRAAINELVE